MSKKNTESKRVLTTYLETAVVEKLADIAALKKTTICALGAVAVRLLVKEFEKRNGPIPKRRPEVDNALSDGNVFVV